jgi:hypothetical protein
MKKFSAVLILSVSMFNLNAFADDGSSPLQKPVMEAPQKPVDVVSGIKAGAIVLRDGSEYGYYEMDSAGQWAFHQLDIVIQGAGRDAHVVIRGLGPVLDSDGHDIAQGLKKTGKDIAQPYQNMKDPNKQDAAHGLGDSGVLVGEAAKNVGKGLGNAGVAVGKTVGSAAVESYGDGNKPDDVVSGVKDTGHFFKKLGSKIIDPFGHVAKVIDGHYVTPIKLENKQEKQAIAEAIAAQQLLDNSSGTINIPSMTMASDNWSQQKPLVAPLLESTESNVQRAPAVLPMSSSDNASQ